MEEFATLMNSARSGCRESMWALFQPHARRLHIAAFARTRSHHDAENIVQDVFMLFMDNKDTVRAYSPARLASWLMRTTCNLCISLGRRFTRRLITNSEGLEDIVDYRENEIDEEHARLHWAIKMLAKPERDLVHAVYWNGKRASEVARKTKTSAAIVSRRLHGAYRKIESLCSSVQYSQL